MSTLFGLLHRGTTGMRANNFGAAVASQNIQNAGTEGYHRRDVQLSPIAPPPPGGGGVEVRGSRRLADRFVEERLLNANADEGNAKAKTEALATLDFVFSEAGGLGAALDAFEAAITELSGRPNETSVRQQVLASSGELAQAFNRAAEDLSRNRSDLDRRMEGEVETLNTRLQEAAALGRDIRRAEALGRPAHDLRDKRDQVVSEIAEALPVDVIEEDDGSVNILLKGSLALITPDGRAVSLGTATDPASGQLRVTRPTAGADQDVTSLLTTGRLGGLIAARDGELAQAETALDQLAFDVASAYNAAHAGGVGADGGTGRNLFTPPTGSAGAAFSMAVSADVTDQPERIAAATDPLLAGTDNRNALALAALSETAYAQGGTATGQESLSALVSQSGHAVVSAERMLDYTGAQKNQLLNFRDSVSGVSVDEELLSLAQYQRGYQASIRIVQAADEMLQELLTIGR